MSKSAFSSPDPIEVKTFTPYYDGIEDRIRLIINYKDVNNRIDLLITRAFISKLIFFIEEYLEKNFNYTNIKSIEYNKEKNSDTINTNLDYLDLVVKEELLRTVNLNLLENGLIKLDLISNNYTAKAILDKDNLINFVNLLKKSIPKYEWGIFL